MFADDLLKKAVDILQICREKQLQIATAESCTGGLIAALFTEIPGSSDVIDRGFVTYSNQAKMQMLGVSENTLKTYGAVSSQTVREMAHGALQQSNAQISVAVTGIAGPGGGNLEKPVGLVYIAIGLKSDPVDDHKFLFGDIGRHNIRVETVRAALDLISRHLSDQA